MVAAEVEVRLLPGADRAVVAGHQELVVQQEVAGHQEPVVPVAVGGHQRHQRKQIQNRVASAIAELWIRRYE